MTRTRVAKRDTSTADGTAETGAGTASTAAAEQTGYPYLERGVDPRALRAVGNSRAVGDIRETRPDLVASIAEHGVNPMVSVINVAPDPDGVFRVLVGFHRTAAAVEVKNRENPDLTVDVLVHAPGTTRRDVLLAQGIENIHRAGYTPTEEAGLYDQLALEGLDDDTIARKLSRPVDLVRAGRAVAASPRTQAAGQVLPDADLFTLAELTEFADDEADHQKLVEVLTSRPHDFEFTVGQLRRRRQQRAKRAEEQRRLTEQGYRIIENEHDLPDGVARLDDLCTGDNTEPLDPAGHTGCPGRAAAVWVGPRHEVEVTELCVDFTAHGHRTIASVRIAAAEAQLREQGVRIVDDPDADGVAELSDLFADSDAEHTLTAEEHTGCPGHAACVEDDPYGPDATVTFVCADYATHGHVLRSARSARPERGAAWKAAETKRAGVNNKLWRTAMDDRRQWLSNFFKGWRKRKPADLPPRVHHWLALAPVLASDHLHEAAPAHRHACTLLGLPEPTGYQRDRNPIAVHLRKKTTTETQAVLIRLAQVIGACEQHWDHPYTRQADASWRRPSENARFYFELLEALGYPLDHVEQLINNPDLDAEKWPHLAADTDTDTAAAADGGSAT